MKILKFGGSSLESPDRISRVLDIINDVRGAGRLCVVVSAWGGVTDSLSDAARVSAQGGNRFRSLCKRLEDRHLDGIGPSMARPLRPSVSIGTKTTRTQPDGQARSLNQQLDRNLGLADCSKASVR